jgi:hypothetical protein
MSKLLNRAVENVQDLPPTGQDRIARDLTRYVDDLQRLRTDLREGLKSLDEGHGKELDIEAVIAPPTASMAESSRRLVAQSLCEFPESGRSRDDLLPGLRSIVIFPAVVFHRLSLTLSKLSALSMAAGTLRP